MITRNEVGGYPGERDWPVVEKDRPEAPLNGHAGLRPPVGRGDVPGRLCARTKSVGLSN